MNDPLYNHTVFGKDKGKGGNIGKSDEKLIADLISIHNAENWLGMDGETETSMFNKADLADSSITELKEGELEEGWIILFLFALFYLKRFLFNIYIYSITFNITIKAFFPHGNILLQFNHAQHKLKTVYF